MSGVKDADMEDTRNIWRNGFNHMSSVPRDAYIDVWICCTCTTFQRKFLHPLISSPNTKNDLRSWKCSRFPIVSPFLTQRIPSSLLNVSSPFERAIGKPHLLGGAGFDDNSILGL